MRGRGIAYVHYKHNETYVAMGMEVVVERASGRIKVERVACAHDCGQIINPDGVRAQVEGCILQTLSRVLMEEVHHRWGRVRQHARLSLRRSLTPCSMQPEHGCAASHSRRNA
jgi:CO/xanthine dehydrogenase Mo-binding subunit